MKVQEDHGVEDRETADGTVFKFKRQSLTRPSSVKLGFQALVVKGVTTDQGSSFSRDNTGEFGSRSNVTQFVSMHP